MRFTKYVTLGILMLFLTGCSESDKTTTLPIEPSNTEFEITSVSDCVMESSENNIVENPDKPAENIGESRPDKPADDVFVQNPDRPAENIGENRPDRPLEDVLVESPDRPSENVLVESPDRPNAN